MKLVDVVIAGLGGWVLGRLAADAARMKSRPILVPERMLGRDHPARNPVREDDRPFPLRPPPGWRDL